MSRNVFKKNHTTFKIKVIILKFKVMQGSPADSYTRDETR